MFSKHRSGNISVVACIAKPDNILLSVVSLSSQISGQVALDSTVPLGHVLHSLDSANSFRTVRRELAKAGVLEFVPLQ